MRAKVIFSAVVAAALGTAWIVLTERNGDPARVVSEFDRRLSDSFQPRPLPTPPSLEGKVSSIVQVAPAWSEVKSLASSLTWQNRQIAEAKALIRYETRPGDVYSYDWDARQATSSRAWQIEESSDFNMRRTKVATIAAAAGFGVSIGVLMTCSWLWGALLRRVRELSNAMRGRE